MISAAGLVVGFLECGHRSALDMAMAVVVASPRPPDVLPHSPDRCSRDHRRPSVS